MNLVGNLGRLAEYLGELRSQEVVNVDADGLHGVHGIVDGLHGVHGVADGLHNVAGNEDGPVGEVKLE